MIKRAQTGTVSRTPPVSVRRQLRAEVDFGCPLCGSPYLEYHHFDPPFADEPHHNPDGMIALCATHHAQANSYTTQQMRDLKSQSRYEVSGQFNWRRRHTVFVCGSNYAYQCRSMLNVHGFDLVYFEKDKDGYDTLSLNIYDICLNRIFDMKQNDWISRTDVDDIEAPPSSRKIRMISKIRQVSVEIEFRDRKMLDADEILVCQKYRIPLDENVVFCYFNGEIAAPLPVKFQNDGIFFGGTVIRGDRLKNCHTGVQVGTIR